MCGGTEWAPHRLFRLPIELERRLNDAAYARAMFPAPSRHD
jgi:hypothetical protein